MDSTEDIQDLIKRLDAVTSSTSSIQNETTRMALVEAARKLTQRLEPPWERMYHICYIQPLTLIALKTAVDLDLFTHLSSTEPRSSVSLAESTHSDPTLLSRILRALVVTGVVDEVDVDAYTSTNLSASLSDANGLKNGLDYLYEATIPQIARMPAYFAAHNYKNPTDHAHAPWKWIAGIPDYPGDRWSWLDTHNLSGPFNAWLASIRRGQAPWTENYDVQKHLLQSWDGTSPFLVDIGGGTGRDITHLANHLSSLTTNTPSTSNIRLILQDRPSVLSQTPSLPTTIEKYPHDFFTPQPIPHARAYFLHSILHDWPDAEARAILCAIIPAMKPNYSKLLLMENVLPERAKECTMGAAVLDLQMMSNYAAGERTEGQWRALIEGVGLRYCGFVRVAGQVGILEAVVEG